MTEALDNTLRLIRRRAGLRGFLAHLALFALCLGIAVALNLDWRYFWPLVGWTIGLILHGLSAIGPGQYIGLGREAERLRQLVNDGEPGSSRAL